MGNQKERTLDYIREYGSITPLEAMRDLGVYRLSAVVFDLKAEGHDIETTLVEVYNRFGGTARVAKYTEKQLEVTLLQGSLEFQ